MKLLIFRFFREKIAFSIIIYGIAVIWYPLVIADTVVTGQVELVNKKGEGIPKVKVQCSLTYNNDNTLTSSCVFKNENEEKRRFLYCSMVDIKNEKIDFPPDTNEKIFNIEKVKEGDKEKIRCVKAPAAMHIGSTRSSSWHFGCIEVELDPGETSKPFIIKSSGKFSPNIIKAKLKASDFQIRYSDVINLSDSDAEYEKVTCQQANTQRGFVVPTLGVKDELKFDFTNWAVEKQPFKDPFVCFQSLEVTCPEPCGFVPDDATVFCGNSPPVANSTASLSFNGDIANEAIFRWVSSDPILKGINTGNANATTWRLFGENPTRLIFLGSGDGAVFRGNVLFGKHNRAVVDVVKDAKRVRYLLKVTKQYALFDDSPCVTSGFPVSVPEKEGDPRSGLPICPLRKEPAPPTSTDINLFWFESMAAPLDATFPAVFDAELVGDTNGIDIMTDPEVGVVFDIPGGEGIFGNLTPCSDAIMSECITPDVEEGRQLRVTINVDSAITGEALFPQDGLFIEDTMPPKILSHTVDIDTDNILSVEVIAFDMTTTPIHADLWYSTDEKTWNTVQLTATPNILEESSTRVFNGAIGSFSSGQIIRFFFSVQDEVSNVAYFGVGEISVP